MICPMRLAISCALLLACAPTETGNPSLTTTSATLVAYSSSPSKIGVGTPTGARVDRGWLSYSRIDLEDCVGAPAQTAVKGPLTDDLAKRPPVSHPLETDIDSFCRVAIPLTPAADPLPAGAPSDLAGRVLVVEGHRGDDVSLLVRSRALRQFVLDASPAGVALSEEPKTLLVAFDVARWFESLDLSAASVDPDGTIRIDETTNAGLLAAFEIALDHSASLHRDLDRDGELDPGELRLDH